MLDPATQNYVIRGRDVAEPLTLNYQQLQEFCRERGVVIAPLIEIALSGRTERRYRGYSIVLEEQQ